MFDYIFDIFGKKRQHKTRFTDVEQRALRTTLQDKIRGSLIGGAVGDALGYPVEFMSYAGIVHKFGERGFEDAVIAAVNHSGDSDSTGAVCGNIMGAIVAYEALPEYFKEDLELHDVILHVADVLWRGKTTKYKQ